MRIALVHMRHARVGGTERFLNHIAVHLAERGHEITIVCRRHDEAPHPDVRFELLRERTFTSAGRMWAFARAVEQHVATVPYDLVFALGKTWTHDVIRSGGGCHQTYVERAHHFVRRPWERALGVGRRKNRLALRIERRAFCSQHTRRIIAISDMVRRDILERYDVPEERVVVVRNGVDIERFHPRLRPHAGAALRESLGWGPDETVVLFLGREFGRKGLEALLHAFARVRASRPELRLAVVGNDRAGGTYERLAHSLAQDDAVRFLGERDDPQVCYAAADLYAMPTHYDAFAFSVLEALATGLPVITTAQSGAAEIITPEVGLVLSNAGDRDELAAALERWCDRDRLHVAAAPTRALAERHTVEASLEATTRVLLDVAAETKKLRPDT